jgi:hypothetical protein
MAGRTFLTVWRAVVSFRQTHALVVLVVSVAPGKAAHAEFVQRPAEARGLQGSVGERELKVAPVKALREVASIATGTAAPANVIVSSPPLALPNRSGAWGTHVLSNTGTGVFGAVGPTAAPPAPGPYRKPPTGYIQSGADRLHGY